MSNQKNNTTPFDWDASTPPERNMFVLSTLPAESPNLPLHAWYLQYNGMSMKSLLVPNREEADSVCARINKLTYEELKQLLPLPGIRVALGKFNVHEETWAMRYSDTEGGAWAVVEQLHKRGFRISMVWDTQGMRLSVGSVATRRLILDEATSFAEGICLLWLKVSEIAVKTKVQIEVIE